MNNLLTLMKADLKETLDIRKFKENKAKSASFLTVLIIVGILALALSTLYNFLFISLFAMAEENLIYSTLMMAGLDTIFVFSTSVFKVKSIFLGKDYEMLSAMPIKKTEIIASKILNLYLIELIYSAIIFIPNILITIIYSHNPIWLMTGLLLMIFVPAVPMLLACLFSMFITLVADRFKFGNIINIILYIFMFAAIFTFSFLMNSSTPNDDNVVDVSNYITTARILTWFNPTLFLAEFSSTINYLYILAFIGVNIVLFIAVTSFIALLFDKVHSIINSYKSNNVYIAKPLETKGEFKNLFFHEIKRFFNTKFYFINCISSGICAILMAVFIGLSFSPWSPMGNVTEEIAAFVNKYAYCGFIIIVFGIGIATPASSSISIEGSKFWMIKSFPIDYKKLMKAKLLVSIVSLGVCGIIASIILCVIVQASIYSYIACLLLTICFVCLASIVSLNINLKHYKLKWSNEQECVKNSSGAVLSMLADWGFMLILAGSVIGLSFINIYLAGGITLGIMLVASVFFYKMLMNNIDKKIERIEEF